MDKLIEDTITTYNPQSKLNSTAEHWTKSEELCDFNALFDEMVRSLVGRRMIEVPSQPHVAHSNKNWV